MFRRFSAVVIGVVLLLGGASAASAATGPVIKLFKDPLPVLGTQLQEDSSYVLMKDGGTITSPYGIKRAQLNYYDVDPTFEILWHYPLSGQPGGATRLAPRGQWSQRISDPSCIDTEDCFGQVGVIAHDERGVTSRVYEQWTFPLSDSHAASYSAGWQTSTCQCYVDGQILFSTKPGATATYQVSGDSLVTFLSDTGPTRGEAAVTINGHTTDVNLGVGSKKVNRVVAWNSGYLDPANSYTVTVRVVSGRVDVEGFIDQKPCCG